ncbi:MAG: HAMP domain-containing histidine kinase, partial [Deltaproteobacteria bacterium]|nr:HAMP domain-containing histidine kinase [Deltaproteobacteria bacterium]MBW2214772.1 HAMP domain-containing histidine kinase [Deltaproteobacteria bacterium]MBW2380532.1 HAMP domain-containing histidine kinase [Deltaproteobacteria bacterium]
MGRPFGLGLRSQLMLALMVAFGAAFVLLSVVTARLDESESVEEQRTRAVGLAQALASGAGSRGGSLSEEAIAGMVEEGLVERVEVHAADGSPRTWGVIDGDPDATVTTSSGVELRVWVPASGRGDAARRSLFLFYLGLTAATVLLLTYVLLTYFIVRPIDQLRLASERLAAGRLRTSVPVRGAAEVARLAATFNEMAALLRADRAALQERLQDLERTTAELTTAQEQLVRSARLAAVGRLSAGVAHEIGNPLAAIRGLLDLMQSGDLDPEEEKEFVGRIQGEAERIHHTIRDLLDFSRNEPAREGQIESSADLSQVVSDTIKLIDRQTRFRDIDFELALDDGLPRVRGDHERLRQLLLNLLFNAADALGGKGRIEVRASNGGGVVQLIVEDDGPGIDREIIEQVFDPFVTTKATGQGTGLGLAVCHTIVEQLGGSIEAVNREQGGAMFEVRLPAA